MAEGPMPMTAGALDRSAAGIRHWAMPSIQAGLLVALLILVYHRTAATLWHIWTTNENYSHGPLVPLVSLALVWMRRRELSALSPRSDARGLLLIGMACALQVIGIRSNVFALEGYSLPIMAVGISMTFLGPAATRVMAFPIAYLVFMLVFPPFVVGKLSYALKEVTVRVSTWVAEAGGVVLQRSGMTLYLTGGVLRIENPCSGLRSLISLLATGALFAYFQPGRWWRKGLLLVAAIPIAMAGNAFRITILILVAHYVGVPQATGKFHDWTGYLIYAVALAGLFALRAVLMPGGKETRA